MVRPARWRPTMHPGSEFRCRKERIIPITIGIERVTIGEIAVRWVIPVIRIETRRVEICDIYRKSPFTQTAQAL